MTDEKRIEEIREERRRTLPSRSIDFHYGDDIDMLLAALDAERARAERAEAERDAALAEVDRVTSIANINATNVDASQAECAALRARMEKAEADRALGAVWRRFFQSISDVEREEFYTLVASYLTGEAADLINELDVIAVDSPECDAIADALREEGGR